MRKLSIIGSGPGWDRAKKDYDEGREIWCPSSTYLRLNSLEIKPSIIFQLHDESIFEPWLKSQERHVMLLKSFPSMPNAMVVPVKRLTDRFGEKFTSSAAWMLALAHDQGYLDINVHGIQMDYKSEYARQRDAFFYFLGWLGCAGVKVNLDWDSGIFIEKMRYPKRM